MSHQPPRQVNGVVRPREGFNAVFGVVGGGTCAAISIVNAD